jgi:dTDP-glucose pyrophosphorylase
MQTTLIIMAAGKSSRYGSLKQTEIIGPSDVTLMEYSIYDAINVGFTEVILILRRETQPYFEAIKNRIGNAIRIEFVYQDLKQFTNNIETHYIREKPWGTAHALLCCKDICKNPFVIINADDFYGKSSFENAIDFFKNEKKSHLIIPYYLQNTLSRNGKVNRGICEIENNILISIKEEIGLTKDNTGGQNPLVSMNFWGFQTSIFIFIQQLFTEFLKCHENKGDEFLLGDVVSYTIINKIESFEVIQSNQQWHGITYKEDKAHAHNALCKLQYPTNLWS